MRSKTQVAKMYNSQNWLTVSISCIQYMYVCKESDGLHQTQTQIDTHIDTQTQTQTHTDTHTHTHTDRHTDTDTDTHTYTIT